MIACLGWGSLIWCPGNLPVGKWQCDGPSVNVEFVRQSKGNRLTLVLYSGAEPMRSYWACMAVDSLKDAVKHLADRECIKCNIKKNIKCWSTGYKDPPNIDGLGSWASQRGIDHVIWTALGPKFCSEDGRAPTEDEAVAYLRKLSVKCITANAKEYVRKAPPQIRTAYRRRIEHCLGWTPLRRNCLGFDSAASYPIEEVSG